MPLWRGNHGYVIASFPGNSSHRNNEGKTGTKICHTWTWCETNLIITTKNKISRLQTLLVGSNVANLRILSIWNNKARWKIAKNINLRLLQNPVFMFIRLIIASTVPNWKTPAWRMASVMTEMEKLVIGSICDYLGAAMLVFGGVQGVAKLMYISNMKFILKSVFLFIA